MADTYAWIMGANGKPTNEYISDLPDGPLTQPYPKTMWRIDPLVNDGKPYHEYLQEPPLLGAFANAINLTNVRIPPTVKKIGRYSFRNTKLTSVTIASDCEYYDTSFPDGCQINFY